MEVERDSITLILTFNFGMVEIDIFMKGRMSRESIAHPLFLVAWPHCERPIVKVVLLSPPIIIKCSKLRQGFDVSV